MSQASLFNKPIYKDWTFWLGCLGVIAVIKDGIGFSSGAVILISLLLIAFQFCLFGVLPAAIRRNIRQRQEKRKWNAEIELAPNTQDEVST